MNFDDNSGVINFAEKLGFILNYFLFTSVLFLILNTSGKMPVSWSYLHIMSITLIITLVGTIIKRILK